MLAIKPTNASNRCIQRFTGAHRQLDSVLVEYWQHARQAILEDLFFDFHRSRRQVYWMNFIRGIFFGIGSALGATLLITLLAWLLGQFADIFPPLADFINHLIETMQHRQ
jgi:ABC-type antimicrobial peptide transport system permease subunit